MEIANQIMSSRLVKPNESRILTGNNFPSVHRIIIFFKICAYRTESIISSHRAGVKITARHYLPFKGQNVRQNDSKVSDKNECPMENAMLSDVCSKDTKRLFPCLQEGTWVNNVNASTYTKQNKNIYLTISLPN